MLDIDENKPFVCQVSVKHVCCKNHDGYICHDPAIGNALDDLKPDSNVLRATWEGASYKVSHFRRIYTDFEQI
jgi:hypothetical protein